ncbi:TOG array regulator of axonemal microtubules protein 1 [Tachyglossus aculeatus]|uniref:TOG array regulator of axonemal microtubules protein 1 n=1 Tax=Tachyglossus aculeatus TaxID=9261 RepID=UPI0018F6B016|nr:TOG array regulator of axonemal microtubules protein 1 [Tachyglossus aculeatus]
MAAAPPALLLPPPRPPRPPPPPPLPPAFGPRSVCGRPSAPPGPDGSRTAGAMTPPGGGSDDDDDDDDEEAEEEEGGEEETESLAAQLVLWGGLSEPSEALRAVRAALGRSPGGPRARYRALGRALGRALAQGGRPQKRLCLRLMADALEGDGDGDDDDEELLLSWRLGLLPPLVLALREEEDDEEEEEEEEQSGVRSQALHVLRRCLRRRPGPVLRALARHGLGSPDPRLRTRTARLLPALLAPDPRLAPRLAPHLAPLALALARRLPDGDPGADAGPAGEEAEAAFAALRHVGASLGPDGFEACLSGLPPALRARYDRRLAARAPSPRRDGGGGGLLLPADLRARLLDRHDYRSRARAVEELKRAVGGLEPGAAARPGLPALVGLLSGLLDDPNFQVVRGALQALRLLVERLGERVLPLLGPVVAAAAKALPDNKPVIKREYLRIFGRLMRAAGPRPVLGLLLARLGHAHARVREEVVNLCIGALLTYPARDLDLPALAAGLAPALLDGRGRVRRAALEAFAVLAASAGPARAAGLLGPVEALERPGDGDGVLKAVRARLARKALPRLTEQGFVEYAGPAGPPAAPGGADADWLLAGNRTRSAHCLLGDSSSPGDDCSGDAPRGSASGAERRTFGPRRVFSAGKGKNRFPWETDPLGVGGGSRPARAREPDQFSANDIAPSPKLRSSLGMPVSEDLCFSRKRVSRSIFQNSLDFSPDPAAVSAGATTGTHQTYVLGKCGQPGFSQIRGKSSSVDSDLQFLGANGNRQEKVCGSFNFFSKTQQTFCGPAERTLSNTNQGAFILPSYPLTSPRTSPKHTPPLMGSPKKSCDNSVHFSNSWPLKSFEGLPKPSPQKKLFGPKFPDPTGDNSPERPSPIQLKPTLVRSPSSRRGLNGTKPVPPIPRGMSLLPDKADLSTVGHKKEVPDDMWKSEKDNLAIDLSELNVRDKESDQEEMQSSLRSVRNSAAKKRAKLSGSSSDLESPDSAIKLDLNVDSPSRSSSPNISPYSESGVYSQESMTSSLSTTPQGKRIMSDIFPFGSKSCPTRLSSTKSKSLHVVEQNSSTGVAPSHVSIIGQRMNCGDEYSGFEEDKLGEITPSVSKSQSKDHQRHYKHTKGFAGSSTNLQQISNCDLPSANTLSEDSVVIVGKGVFGSPNAVALTSIRSGITSSENGDAYSLGQSSEPPSGIYGRAVQQNGQSYLDVFENEKEMKISLSKSAYDKMRQKKKEEKEMNPKELNEVKDYEKKKQSPWERLKCTVTEKTTMESEAPTVTRPQYKERIPSVTHSPEIMDPAELRPFSKPELALAEALRLLADDDWEKKIEGLNSIRCLSAFHSNVLTAKLHETSIAVIQEVKNLRSGVSRAAVVCLGDLFTYLKRGMDQELDATVKVLLHKAGESNTFIREDVDKALKAMVNNVTPARAVASLINGGQSHLHIAVRRCTAQHLSDVVEQMESARILSGTKDMADRLLPTAAKFAQDSSQETRYYGRKMLFFLMSHSNFDKMLEKHVPSKDLPYIKDSVKNLRQKGLGEMPLETPSAKGRRSNTGSVGRTRSSSISREAHTLTEREFTEVREISRKPAPRNSLESAEYLEDITGLLNAKDFRDRISGIKQLLSDAENNQELVVGNIVKIFDAFKSRLHDSNSKVNLVALETMHKMIPLLKDNLSPVINMLIPAIVDNNLNSKNPGIYAATTNVIQALSQHLDNYLLLQPFCTKAQFLNGKAKQDMTEKLADLVTELHQRKPLAIEQKVLVVLWHLLGNLTNSGAGGNIRTATAKLSKALFAQMGPNLLSQAASQPPHIKKSLEELLDMTP